MLQGKGRQAVHKVDQDTVGLPPREEKEGHRALRHDVGAPLGNTSLSTVLYALGGAVITYLIYAFAFQ